MIYLNETEYRKGVLAVCDRESSYTGQLAEYMDTCKKLPFEIQAFTALDSLKEYACRHPIDLLLASAEFVPGALEQENIRKIMMLTEDQEEAYMNLESAYKYQPAEALLQEVLNYYSKEYPKIQTSPYPKRLTEFYAVYSPIKRCGKTGFSIMLGQALARQKRVLYLNFEEYSGFGKLFGKEPGDFSELLLHLRQGRTGVYRKIQKLVRPLGRIDYLPPGIGHTDFYQMDWEHWERLFQAIRLEEVYDAVILDVGNLPEVLFGLLEFCKAVYMPVLQDAVSEAKLEEFQWVCSSIDNGIHMKKLTPVMPPEEAFWEMLTEDKLTKSELFQYAEKVLEG